MHASPHAVINRLQQRGRRAIALLLGRLWLVNPHLIDTFQDWACTCCWFPLINTHRKPDAQVGTLAWTHMQVLLLSCCRQCYLMTSVILMSILKYSDFIFPLTSYMVTLFETATINHLSSRRDVFKHVPEDSSLRCWWRRPKNSSSRLQNLSFVWASVSSFLFHSQLFPDVSFYNSFKMLF